MKSKYLTLAISLALLLGMASPLLRNAKAETTPIVRVVPSETGPLSPGAEFTISVEIVSPDIAIWSGQIGIGFNKDVLECKSFAKGSAIDPSWLWMPGTIRNDLGWVTYSGWSCVAGQEPGWTGTGVFITYTFKVKSYYSGDVTLDLTTATTDPDKYYRTKLNKKVDTQIIEITPITLEDGIFHGQPPPPPYGPTAHLKVVTIPPYYENVTEVVFDASESEPGFDGTNLVPIDWYYFDFGDGSPPVNTTTPSASHVYQHAGTYTVTLTVHAPVPPPTPSTDDDQIQITVFAKAVGPAIDLFTQSYRSYPPHYTPYNGTGPEQETDAFQPQDLVILYAKVTYNDDPVQNKLVAFEVRDPWQRKVFVRTAPTNASGIATIDFRIPWPCENPENETFGQWQAYADVDIAEKKVSDFMTWQVGWIISTSNFKTTSSNAPYPPCDTFKKGEHVSFSFTYTNIAKIYVKVYFVITVYDVEHVPIGIIILGPWSVAPGTRTHVEVDLLIPKWAYVGVATAYLNAYTEIPMECGVPYCPEIFYVFAIQKA
jgi:hypothetical protein